MRFAVRVAKGEFAAAMEEIYQPIADAGTAAIREASEVAKTEGRRRIAAAGFSKKWQNTLRAEAYPKRGESASAAAWIYHRIPYAAVFEEGATIRGRPRLWVPMSHAPKLTGRERLTPQNFTRKVGPLFSMRGARKPVLAANLSVSKSAARRGPPYKPTRAGLRKGAAGQGIVRAVPIFVGVDTVSIRKRFDLRSAFEGAADQLPNLYLKHLRTD
jgi:hypothetical protein